MNTTTLSPSKRKIINLDEETFKTLSIMAIEEGTNLKNYIEKVLSDIADNYQDSKLYAKLSKERPEGHIILNQQEKTDFEKSVYCVKQSQLCCVGTHEQPFRARACLRVQNSRFTG